MSIPRVHLVSLGCAKNTVDSQSMLALLGQAGYTAVPEPEQADVLVVNTCGFIAPARQESIAVLREMAAKKHPGQLLIAAGCLSQRHGADVVREVPGVDGLLGTRNWREVVTLVTTLRKGGGPGPHYDLPDEPTVGRDDAGVLRSAVQGVSAYLKIADGCRRPCAFCSIPLIKGTAVSRPPEAILAEARRLQAGGVRELILIAQDTTDYGHDLGLRDGLADLLVRIGQDVPEIDWVRILYAYPGAVTPRLMEVMAEQRQVLPYLDMPLQHADPGVLRRMRRPANMAWVHSTLARMRTMMPDLALRTTFIVGYPGETESEFERLLEFVEAIRFDRVGVFAFSFEPGTASEPLGDPVPAEVKEERRDRLMRLQQRISLERNQALVGKTLSVLIEGHGDGLTLGRSYRDAPEIDGLVMVEGDIPDGEIVPVQITGALPYDLSGAVVRERPAVLLQLVG